MLRLELHHYSHFQLSAVHRGATLSVALAVPPEPVVALTAPVDTTRAAGATNRVPCGVFADGEMPAACTELIVRYTPAPGAPSQEARVPFCVNDVQRRTTVATVVQCGPGRAALSLSVSPTDTAGYHRRVTDFCERHCPERLPSLEAFIATKPEVEAMGQLRRVHRVMDYAARAKALLTLYHVPATQQAEVDFVLRTGWVDREEAYIRSLVFEHGPEAVDISPLRRFNALAAEHSLQADPEEVLAEYGDSVHELFSELATRYGGEPSPATYLFDRFTVVDLNGDMPPPLDDGMAPPPMDDMTPPPPPPPAPVPVAPVAPAAPPPPEVVAQIAPAPPAVEQPPAYVPEMAPPVPTPPVAVHTAVAPTAPTHVDPVVPAYAPVAPAPAPAAPAPAPTPAVGIPTPQFFDDDVPPPLPPMEAPSMEAPPMEAPPVPAFQPGETVAAATEPVIAEAEAEAGRRSPSEPLSEGRRQSLEEQTQAAISQVVADAIDRAALASLSASPTAEAVPPIPQPQPAPAPELEADAEGHPAAPEEEGSVEAMPLDEMPAEASAEASDGSVVGAVESDGASDADEAAASLPALSAEAVQATSAAVSDRAEGAASAEPFIPAAVLQRLDELTLELRSVTDERDDAVFALDVLRPEHAALRERSATDAARSEQLLLGSEARVIAEKHRADELEDQLAKAEAATQAVTADLEAARSDAVDRQAEAAAALAERDEKLEALRVQYAKATKRGEELGSALTRCRAEREEARATIAGQKATVAAAEKARLRLTEAIAEGAGRRIRLQVQLGQATLLVPCVPTVTVGDFKHAAVTRAVKLGMLQATEDVSVESANLQVVLPSGIVVFDEDTLDDVGLDTDGQVNLTRVAAAVTLSNEPPASPTRDVAPEPVPEPEPEPAPATEDAAVVAAVFLDAAAAADLADHEGLERRLINEHLRMETEALVAQEATARRASMRRGVEGARMALVDRAMYGTTQEHRAAARVALSRLETVLQDGAASEGDLAGAQRLAMAVPSSPGDEGAKERVAAMQANQRTEERQKARLVADLRDMTDTLQFRIRPPESAWARCEELVSRGRSYASIATSLPAEDVQALLREMIDFANSVRVL